MSDTKPSDWGDKRIFTTGEAAQVCKVSQQTIIRCFDSGRLTGFRVPGSKFRRIPREELVRFMRANNIPLDPLEGARRRVLIVDDDKGVLELLVDIIQRDGRFEIKTASTGYDAGLMTESFKPHLLLLDYMLPDLNGNIVCQRIRAGLSRSRLRITSKVMLGVGLSSRAAQCPTMASRRLCPVAAGTSTPFRTGLFGPWP